MRIATMAREAEHRGKPTTSVKRTVTCLRSASMGAFSCKMLDEKICRAVVVTFAVALDVNGPQSLCTTTGSLHSTVIGVS